MSSPPSPAPSVGLERGQTIDRFVVIGLVGRGGMGEVYAAYDPELDRKVAIKLLRARGDTADGRTRLLREAQAIAKLSHPSVVVVYDVGTFGDSVFIAMEFVEGRTLTGWMQAGQRSRREILQVFLSAGRGLAAAHAAGLVHRDFKPDNVMVTNDGQVRVMDFGLARQTSDAEGAPPRREPPAPSGNPADTFDPSADPDATLNIGQGSTGDPPATSGKYLSVKLTQTGAMLGTPAYMAPEQFAMTATDARTDQFSFCVALYELLYGARPFPGESFLTLMTSVTTGAIAEAPPKARVPGWLRKVVLRGLETDPQRRHPSMTALLSALETDPTIRWRRAAAGVGLLACAVLAVVGARRAAGSRDVLCRSGAERWAGVWAAEGASATRKEAIHRAFTASGRSYAAQAFAGTSRVLDAYVSKWLAMYTDACEATHVRGEQSAEVLDLRMSCLQDRLTSAGALTDIFTRADGTVVENAVSAAGALPALERCGDVSLLRAVIKPPEDEASRKRVDALRAELATLAATRTAGRCSEAERLAQELIPRVRATGYAPLLAETLNESAILSDLCIDISVGAARWKEAFALALESRHDEVAAQAASFMGGFLSDRAAKTEEGRQWLDLSRALLRRIGSPRLLSVWVDVSESVVLMHEGRSQQSVAIAERVIRAKEEMLGKDDPDLAISLNNYGNALQSAGRLEDAKVAFARAVELTTRVLGVEHPRLAIALEGEGEILSALHQHDEALVAFQRSVDIWLKAGTDPTMVAYGHNGVGTALLSLDRPSEAIAPLEEALRIRLDKHVDPATLGETRFALAHALWSVPARRPRALALGREARADYAQDKTATAKIDAWLASPTTRR